MWTCAGCSRLCWCSAAVDTGGSLGPPRHRAGVPETPEVRVWGSEKKRELFMLLGKYIYRGDKVAQLVRCRTSNQ